MSARAHHPAVGRAALVALLALLLPRLASAQAEPRPRLDAARVTGEVLAGAYAGIGGFYVGQFLGHELADAVGVESDVTRRRVALTTGALAATAATAGMVYAIGNIGDETGDFDTTLLGTGAGVVVGLVLSRALVGPDFRPREGMSTSMRWAAINVIALLPAIGATIAFNSTRRVE